MVLGVHFPSDGFRVTTAREVGDSFGSTILLAVGDCVGGVNPAVDRGDIHVSSAKAQGCAAGRTAAGRLAGTSGAPARARLLDAQPLPTHDQVRMEIVHLDTWGSP
jgi:succinate dehydrogenase/fumarate reductase flavoprotein subunit